MHNRTTRLAVVFPVTLALCLASPVAKGDVILFAGDKEGWEAAVDDFTTISFTEFPSGTWVFEQYADLGVHFIDGADIIQCCNFELYPEDGAGLDGNEEIHLVFDVPMNHIAADFPGILVFDLYWQGEPIYFSPFFGGGGPGHFGGLVSDEPFDEVRIWDLDGQVSLDNLHFGPPIPAPGAIVGVATLALLGRRRRRTA